MAQKTPAQVSPKTMDVDVLAEQVSTTLQAADDKAMLVNFIERAKQSAPDSSPIGLSGSINHLAKSLAGKGRGGSQAFSTLLNAATESKNPTAGATEEVATVVEHMGPETALTMAYNGHVGDREHMAAVKGLAAKVGPVFERLVQVPRGKYDESTAELRYEISKATLGSRDALGPSISKMMHRHDPKDVESAMMGATIALSNIGRLDHQNLKATFEAAAKMDGETLKALSKRINNMGAPLRMKEDLLR